MKKLIFLVAAATLLFASCQKEIESANQDSKSFAFKASIEQLADPDTKASLNAENKLEWYDNGKTGEQRVADKIGIYFDSWTDNKNQAFTLSSGAGTTQGEFIMDNNWPYNPNDATVAFFPWQDYGSDKNNVWNGTMYFKLPDAYWSYDNGDMLTPLVASLSSSNSIDFKHAGGAVKLTINNLVSGTYAVKMSVADEQITGDFHINPANAGTDALALDNAKDASKNNITLNTWKSNGAFTWIFPVPELTKPKLSFEIKDENGIIVWEKNNLKAQENDITRGDILVMPALSVNAYKQFDTNAGWGVCGTHNSWSGDTKMVTDGSLCIAKSIEFAANAEFKVRTVGNWGDAGTDNFGWSNVNDDKSYKVDNVKGVEDNGGNIRVKYAGTYDVIFNSSGSKYSDYEAHEIRVVQSKYPYPLPKETASITIDGLFDDWAGVTSEGSSSTTVKVVSDNTNLYFYVQKVGLQSKRWGNSGYLYACFDLDGDTSNDVDLWGNTGDFVALIYPYGGSSASPAINTSYAVGGSWTCLPNSPYTVNNISLDGTFSDADGSGNRTVTLEFSIPRADMPTIPSTDPITITIKGSDLSTVPISRKL